MIKLRNAQKVIMQADQFKSIYDMDEIVTRIIERLRSVEILPPIVVDENNPDNHSPEELELRAEVRREVDRALMSVISQMSSRRL